jgi:hypothetical protein
MSPKSLDEVNALEARLLAALEDLKALRVQLGG